MSKFFPPWSATLIVIAKQIYNSNYDKYYWNNTHNKEEYPTQDISNYF